MKIKFNPLNPPLYIDDEEHASDKNNPHSVTKEQVGLGNVDNTSDLDKGVSTATQTALDLKADKAAIGFRQKNTAYRFGDRLYFYGDCSKHLFCVFSGTTSNEEFDYTTTADLVNDGTVVWIVDRVLVRTNIVNDLTTGDNSLPLSSAMGKKLNDEKADIIHTHEQSDVTGLSQALNGKANTTHTHEMIDITGLIDSINGIMTDANNLNARVAQNTFELGNKIGFADTVDNLESESAYEPLSAKQGKILSDRIAGIQPSVVAWDASTAYEATRVVSHNQKLWITLTGSVAGEEPGVSNAWQDYFAYNAIAIDKCNGGTRDEWMLDFLPYCPFDQIGWPHPFFPKVYFKDNVSSALNITFPNLSSSLNVTPSPPYGTIGYDFKIRVNRTSAAAITFTAPEGGTVVIRNPIVAESGEAIISVYTKDGLNYIVTYDRDAFSDYLPGLFRLVDSKMNMEFSETSLPVSESTGFAQVPSSSIAGSYLLAQNASGLSSLSGWTTNGTCELRITGTPYFDTTESGITAWINPLPSMLEPSRSYVITFRRYANGVIIANYAFSFDNP